ncbi:WD repeat-containing protein 66 [Fasciola gigantica]|uniref:Cilia- and flagella-associated protein 251 n=1 Tax=Fasciola gigantica TaxID=46835 RepID=A0A504YNE0_FASGI|nr:WD repeat-containing protein 66 [Fasciola gigantica]
MRLSLLTSILDSRLRSVLHSSLVFVHFRPHLVICSLTGLLKVYDYETRMVIAMKDYGSNEGIQTCRYGPLGKYLAVGFTSGYVRIVDAITLEDVTPEPFTYGRGAITHVDFSPRGDYCAYADSSHTTTLLRASNDDTEPPWHYVGRIRVHYRPITDLMFWIGRGCKNCRLFTISEDRTLAEYDISHASLHNFPLMARYRVEQLATPLCFSRLPPYYKEEFLFVATSTMKLKLLNSTSFMCRKVVMARPEAIQYHKVLPLPSKKSATAHFLVCISEERLAVVMLPLDGDPLKSTNVIAHPSGPRGTGRASSMAVSHCGRYAFTAGGPDDCVHMWAINPKTLEDRVKCAVDVKYRFYKLITPEFLHELKDYYYYSMLRTQGLRCLETRHTSMTIPITEIPFVMRAIGYYPTEEDIENMINEVKYSGFVETGTYVSDIDLDTFIQMYCNYKPFQGIFYKDVESAFHQLCVVRDLDTGKALKFRDPQAKITDPKSIPPEYLFSYLQTIGEPIGESELTEYLSTLLGYFPEGGRPENTVMVDEHEMNKAVDACLPVFLNAENFVYNILGMRPCSTENPEPNPLKCDKLRVCSADHERSESNIVSSTQTE